MFRLFFSCVSKLYHTFDVCKRDDLVRGNTLTIIGHRTPERLTIVWQIKRKKKHYKIKTRCQMVHKIFLIWASRFTANTSIFFSFEFIVCVAIVSMCRWFSVLSVDFFFVLWYLITANSKRITWFVWLFSFLCHMAPGRFAQFPIVRWNSEILANYRDKKKVKMVFYIWDKRC